MAASNRFVLSRGPCVRKRIEISWKFQTRTFGLAYVLLRCLGSYHQASSSCTDSAEGSTKRPCRSHHLMRFAAYEGVLSFCIAHCSFRNVDNFPAESLSNAGPSKYIEKRPSSAQLPNIAGTEGRARRRKTIFFVKFHLQRRCPYLASIRAKPVLHTPHYHFHQLSCIPSSSA